MCKPCWGSSWCKSTVPRAKLDALTSTMNRQVGPVKVCQDGGCHEGKPELDEGMLDFGWPSELDGLI